MSKLKQPGETGDHAAVLLHNDELMPERGLHNAWQDQWQCNLEMYISNIVELMKMLKKPQTINQNVTLQYFGPEDPNVDPLTLSAK